MKEITSQQLKKIRKEFGLTQKEFAEKLNTPLRTYQDWEYKHTPGVVSLAIEGMKKEKNINELKVNLESALKIIEEMEK